MRDKQNRRMSKKEKNIKKIKKNVSDSPTQPQQAAGYAANLSLRDRHF